MDARQIGRYAATVNLFIRSARRLWDSCIMPSIAMHRHSGTVNSSPTLRPNAGPLNEAPKFRALPRDRSRRRVHESLWFNWEILEGDGSFQGVGDQEVEYRAPATPGLARLRVTVIQREAACSAEALVTITDSLDTAMSSAVTTRGLPGYTFERAAGELWRCRFDTVRASVTSRHSNSWFGLASPLARRCDLRDA